MGGEIITPEKICLKQTIPGKTTDLRVELHSKIQVMRTLENFIKKPEFTLYYATLNEEGKTFVVNNVLEGNMSVIKKLYFDWQIIHYGFGDIRYLRSKASMLGIPYYATLSREQLMKEIYNASHSTKVS